MDIILNNDIKYLDLTRQICQVACEDLKRVAPGYKISYYILN